MKEHVHYLNGRGNAHEIEINLNLAYWAASCGGGQPTLAEYHYGNAINAFRGLAAALGYRVEKVEPEEPAIDALPASPERSHGLTPVAVRVGE